MPDRGTRIAIVSLAVVVIAACGGSAVRLPGSIDPPREVGPTPAPATLRVRVNGTTQRVRLSDYVVGTTLSEITPTGESATTVARVYEVQSVVARSWALAHLGRHRADGFDLCDETHCQLYQPDRLRTSSFARAASDAERRTRGRVLWYGGQPVDAVFHADCGGHTTTPTTAWNGTDFPYLPARADQVPGVRHRTWTFELSAAEWRTLLNGDGRTAVGNVFGGMAVVRTGPGDRVTQLRISGSRERMVSGEVLRIVVGAARGPRAVMSSRFSVETSDTGIRLIGTGFGHGVGLCQVGAMARARRGDSLADILKHYFPGTELQ
jgi:stage II sporulation protein D